MAVAQNSDRRSAWGTGPSRDFRQGLGEPSLPPPSRTGARFMASLWRGVKTLFVLGLLGVGGYYGWQHGKPLWNKMRLNADVEGAATFFIRQLPEKSASEAELKQAVAAVAEDRLKGHLAIKARWFVAFGPSGKDLRIVRNDHFGDTEKALMSRWVDDAKRRNDAVGLDVEKLDFPRGAFTQPVALGDETWIVIAGWAEESE